MAEVLSPEEFAARYGRQEEEEAETLSPEDFAARYSQEPERNIGNDPYEILKMLNPVATEIANVGMKAAPALLHAPNAALFGGGSNVYGALRAGGDALANPQGGPSELLKRYRMYRDQGDKVLDQASVDAPTISTLSALGGGVVTGKIPSKLVNPGPGFIKGAVSGGAIGAGSGMLQSRNDYTTPEGITSAPADAVGGAMWGAPIGAMFGGIRNLFKDKETVAKLAQAKFNTPRQVLEQYIEAGGNRGDKLLSARPRNEVNEDLKTAMKSLKDRIFTQDKASIDVLDAENSLVNRKEIGSFINDEIRRLKDSDKFLGKSPRRKVEQSKRYLQRITKDLSSREKKYLEKLEQRKNQQADKITAFYGEGGAAKLAKLEDTYQLLKIKGLPLPLRDVKKIVQGIQEEVADDYSKEVTKRLYKGPLKRVAKNINGYLKGRSPNYDKIMAKLSADVEAFEDISKKLGRSDKTRINTLRSAFTQAEHGIGKQQREAIQKLDKFLGTNLDDKALWSHFAEQFDKTSINGSMNQKRWAELLKYIPGGNLIAPIMGSIQDQFGRANARNAIELYIGLQRLMREDQTGYRKYLAQLMKLAQQGNPEAAATIYIINQTNPPREK